MQNIACVFYVIQSVEIFQHILIIKPTRCTNFSNLFLDSFSVHHQESSTVHTAIVICHTGYDDCLLAGSIMIPLASSHHNLYDI